MIRVRVISPAEITERVLPLLTAESGVASVQALRVSRPAPERDILEFDVVRGRADEVIARLRQFGVDQMGSISLEDATTSISQPRPPAGRRRSHFDDFAPVWAAVDARIRETAQFAPSWYALLQIAGLIASVGLLTNSQILIVGAMVVGPEYGAVMAFAFGLLRRDRALAFRSVMALVAGFLLAIAGSLLLALLVRAGGLEPRAFALGVRPVSHLINTPDWYSFIVAVLAGMVGVISLTEARTSTLIGVFISVTTIPAAADIGVSIAYGGNSEALGSAEQLLLNLAVLALVAVFGIPVQRRLWRRMTKPRLQTQSRSGGAK